MPGREESLIAVPRAALDAVLSAAIDLERRARVADPRLREALAGVMAQARPVPAPRSHWSIAEAASRLGVSERTVRRRLADGSLPGRRLGRRWLIPAMNGHERTGADEPVAAPGPVR